MISANLNYYAIDQFNNPLAVTDPAKKSFRKAGKEPSAKPLIDERRRLKKEDKELKLPELDDFDDFVMPDIDSFGAPDIDDDDDFLDGFGDFEMPGIEDMGMPDLDALADMDWDDLPIPDDMEFTIPDRDTIAKIEIPENEYITVFEDHINIDGKIPVLRVPYYEERLKDLESFDGFVARWYIPGESLTFSKTNTTAIITIMIIDTAKEIKVGMGYNWAPVVLGRNEM